MTILQWIMLVAFAGGVFLAVLSFIFRWDMHSTMLPNLYLLAIAIGMFAIGALAGIVWILKKLF